MANGKILKITALILTVLLILGLCACEKDNTQSDTVNTSKLEEQIRKYDESLDTDSVSSNNASSESKTPIEKEETAPHSDRPLDLVVEYTTQISPGNPGWWESGVEYSRVIELQHSACGDNGLLLATFEELNGGQVDPCGYPIYASRDRGKTWVKQAFVSESRPTLSAQWMPMLYELPKALGDMPAGTVLLAATSLGSGLTANVLYKSTDSGMNWSYCSNIAVGGNYGNGEGIYEPFLVQLDDGTLVCYYSDELEKAKHSQRLVYRTTKDGKNWSDTVEIVSLEQQSLRPGMPVVTRLGDGRYFMVYEMVGMNGNPIHCKYSKNGLDWGDPKDIGTLIRSETGKQLGSAPYCAWTPQGGKNGTIIVSGTFMSNGYSSTGTDYFLSYDYGKTWETMPHPIPYSTAHNKIGYSNGFFFSASGKYLYAVNNPDGKTEGHSQIVFARVKLYD